MDRLLPVLLSFAGLTRDYRTQGPDDHLCNDDDGRGGDGPHRDPDDGRGRDAPDKKARLFHVVRLEPHDWWRA